MQKTLNHSPNKRIFFVLPRESPVQSPQFTEVEMKTHLSVLTLLMLALLLTVHPAEAQMAPDGSWVGAEPQLAPDGSWVGGEPQLAPDGSWVGGKSRMAPAGSWVGGKPQMAPDGSWVGGKSRIAPDGSWVGDGQLRQERNTSRNRSSSRFDRSGRR